VDDGTGIIGLAIASSAERFFAKEFLGIRFSDGIRRDDTIVMTRCDAMCIED